MNTKPTNSQRVFELYKVLNQWMTLYEQGRGIDEILLENQIHAVAIYGYGNMAIHLYNALISSEITVCGIIDKRASENHEFVIKIPVVDEIIPSWEIDAIIVTEPLASDVLLREIEDRNGIRVIRLSDVVFDCV